ncbi:MAG: bifunctional diguanylate cyclase/phosphodiesterase, partial [Burkholderiales bacterium]
GGPASTACRENRPYTCNDIGGDPNTRPWRGAVASAGCRATASFPIHQHNEVIGVLGLYAPEIGFFDAQLSDLLQKMAANISLALDNFAHDAKRRAIAKALYESEARYRSLVDMSPEAILVCDDGKFALVNQACVHLLGVANPGELIGRHIIDFVHPSHCAVANHRARDILEGRGAGVFTEARWMRADGSAFDAEIAGTLIDYRGRMVVQEVVRDISERKQTERILRILAEGAALSFGESFFPALVRHLAKALQVRHAVIAECLDDQFVRSRVLAFWKDGDWIPGYVYDIANTPCRKLLEDDAVCYYPENVQQFFPGNERWPALNISCYLGLPLNDTAGKIIGHIFVMHDTPLPNEERAKSIFSIFAARAAAELVRKRAEEDMRHMAHHDALTGLPNRLLFHDRISHAIVQARRYRQQAAVLFLDLDRFKNINDTLGHEAGDSALREMATRLQAALRESDTIARVGGDEFMVLIDSFAELRYLSEVSQKILDAAARPFVLEGQECHVGVSIGIATYPDDGHDVHQLLKNADIAMYRAKSLGKNNFQFYSAQMNVHTLEHLALESRLRRAIENRELVLHYQPKVSFASGRIAGAEALVRWQHPQRRLLAPDQFIPLAEETGLIVKLGEWVINEACAQAARWRQQGLPALRMAINLSARQFTHEGLLPVIREALRNTGLDPAQVEFEITESMVIDKPEHAAALMHELKALGVKLSIDDFGTGYSSLAYLKRFPIDTLKIDRSFIHGVPHDSDDVAITQAVIAMAHSMQKTVIAEGVETEIQSEFLRRHHCDQLQGYYFSKPLPAEAFAELLRKADLRA